MVDTDDAVAAADKQMEERAARAKALLSQRYKGLRTDQVRYMYESFHTTETFLHFCFCSFVMFFVP
jgi:hypothetical protein